MSHPAPMLDQFNPAAAAAWGNRQEAHGGPAYEPSQYPYSDIAGGGSGGSIGGGVGGGGGGAGGGEGRPGGGSGPGGGGGGGPGGPRGGARGPRGGAGAFASSRSGFGPPVVRSLTLPDRTSSNPSSGLTPLIPPAAIPHQQHYRTERLAATTEFAGLRPRFLPAPSQTSPSPASTNDIRPTNTHSHPAAAHPTAGAGFAPTARRGSYGHHSGSSRSSFTYNQSGLRDPIFSRPARKMQSMPTEEELAQLQKLSNEYQPTVEGPLVGELQPSQAITTEYAHADPIFVQKTAALPRKYSHYRTVKGDGNCGWRAIAYSYFEALQRTGDRGRILEEETRLRSLNNLLNTAGFRNEIYIDFVEETIDLLRQLADPQAAKDGKLLLEKFNDAGVSSAVITHFRLLTSAWMKTRPEVYQPFILDGTVEQYCASQIEPYQVEIEHIGMNAVIDVLVKPAGFAVEILYLDRSAGAEVNEHRFEAAGPTGVTVPDAPTLRLLYRPGHYDILYKAEDHASPLTHTQVYIGSFTDVSAHELPNPNAGVDMAPYLASLPGMSYIDSSGNGMVPVSLSPGPVASARGTVPVSPISPSFPHSSLPMTPSSAAEGGLSGLGSFRHSKYEYEEFFPSPTNHMPFQTATFRNSHFNPAHFRNSDFQPELWNPEQDGLRSAREDSGRFHH